MKILSLFDGISCARVACDRAGIPVESYWASEIDKYAIQVSEKNYPDIVRLGDIDRLVNPEGLSLGFVGKGFLEHRSNIDLIIGGSPCQDLSIAKANREGLAGKRSGLFYRYLDMLRMVKPKFFILENVASMPKSAKATISEELWGIEPVMINANLVSAQNRKRLFWVGKLVGDHYEQVKIPLPEDRGIMLRDILEAEVDEKYIINQATNKFNTHQANRVYNTDGKAVTLKALGGGGGAKTGLYRVIDKHGNEKLKSNTVRSSGRGSGVDDKHNWDSIRVEPVALTERRTEEAKRLRREHRAKTGKDYSPRRGKELTERTDGKANCVTTGGTKESLVKTDSIIRKLTPVECERLQGLPDNYSEGVSNTQRYKALGNAFNVDVVAHILKHLN